MKNVLLYLSLLLASGSFAGDWQYVAESTSLEPHHISQSDTGGGLNNTILDDLEHAVLPDVVGIPAGTITRQSYQQSFSSASSETYSSNPIRAPPASHI